MLDNHNNVDRTEQEIVELDNTIERELGALRLVSREGFAALITRLDHHAAQEERSLAACKREFARLKRNSS